jgi:hypothetical protein
MILVSAWVWMRERAWVVTGAAALLSLMGAGCATRSSSSRYQALIEQASDELCMCASDSFLVNGCGEGAATASCPRSSRDDTESIECEIDAAESFVSCARAAACDSDLLTACVETWNAAVDDCPEDCSDAD